MSSYGENTQALSMAQMIVLSGCDGQPGRCVRCGIITRPPHKMRDGRCVLANVELTDRPCKSCGIGLHSSQYCPAAFQSNFKHPADVVVGDPKN